MTHAEQLLATLPAGEWANVRVLKEDEADGGMALRDWAILAEANSLRHGGRDAFLKCIVAATSGAGNATRQLTGRQRLERVRDRLAEVSRMTPPVPLVEILECRFLDGFDALLIAMEKVTTLHTLISERRAGAAVAQQVLQRLAPPRHDVWHHFDVCPKNAAITKAGAVVYIDVESFYVCKEFNFQLSNFFCKDFRLPAPVFEALCDDFAVDPNRLTVDAAALKQSFDVALLAAECSLNCLPPFVQGRITVEWLESIAEMSNDETKVLAEFWVRHLRPAVEKRAVLDLQLISKELAAFTVGKGSPNISVARTSEPAVPRTAQTTPRPVTDFDREWETLQPKARALRRDSLSRADIQTYRDQLETISRSHPKEPRVWDELLLILISYQRNRVEALRIARVARKHAHQNPNLKRMCDIVEMWAA